MSKFIKWVKDLFRYMTADSKAFDVVVSAKDCGMPVIDGIVMSGWYIDADGIITREG